MRSLEVFRFSVVPSQPIADDPLSHLAFHPLQDGEDRHRDNRPLFTRQGQQAVAELYADWIHAFGYQF